MLHFEKEKMESKSYILLRIIAQNIFDTLLYAKTNFSFIHIHSWNFMLTTFQSRNKEWSDLFVVIHSWTRVKASFRIVSPFFLLFLKKDVALSLVIMCRRFVMHVTWSMSWKSHVFRCSCNLVFWSLLTCSSSPSLFEFPFDTIYFEFYGIFSP